MHRRDHAAGRHKVLPCQQPSARAPQSRPAQLTLRAARSGPGEPGWVRPYKAYVPVRPEFPIAATVPQCPHASAECRAGGSGAS